jgi:hypothetical protein
MRVPVEGEDILETSRTRGDRYRARREYYHE